MSLTAPLLHKTREGVLIMGATTKKWYLEPGVEAEPPSGNKIIFWEAP